MAVLPNKILTDEKIAEFINQTNINAKNIVGDSKFIIPDPSLPGTGLLIKLWIRQAEKAFSSYLVPILVIKEVLSKPLEIPGKFNDIRGFIENPLQALLDETINNQVASDFFLPLRLILDGKSSADFGRLKDLVDRADSERSSPAADTRPKFPYVLGKIGAAPADGEYTINTADPETSTSISISLQDYNGDSTGVSFSSLVQGDIISLDQDGISQSWVIKSIIVNPGYYTFGVVPQNETAAQEIFAVQEKTVYFQTAPNPLTAGSKALLALLTDGSGKIKFPITITLSDLLPIVGLPAIGSPLNLISLEVGNFNALPKDSALAKKIKDLEDKSGWNFQTDVLDKIFKGKYPKLDYPADPNQPKSEKLKAREELLAIAKLVQLIFTSPGDFFKIIGNYLKLLLLPLQIVVGTIKALFAAVLENPLSIFSLIAKLLTDPIRALGDLIAKAVLSTIRPYLEPTLTAAGISWEDATNERINGNPTGKGLQPLVSDLVIGRFKCGEIKGTGNGTITQTSPTPGATGSEASIQFTNYSYVVKYDGTPPQEGEVSLNNLDLNKVTVIKISSLDSNVNSTLTNLVELLPGSEISIPKDGGTWVYAVNQRISPTGNLSYFDYQVSLVYGPEQDSPAGIADQIDSASSPVNGTNRAVLSPGANLANFKFTSSDPFLQCLIDNYLPIKIIAIWESVKGILGVILGFVATIPFLIKAVFESLFSLPDFSNPLAPILDSLVNPRNDPKGTPLDGIFDQNQSASVLDSLDSFTAVNGIDQIFKRTSDNTSLKTVFPERVTDLKYRGNIGIGPISTVELGKRIKVLLALAKLEATTVNDQGEPLVNFSAATANVSQKTVTVEFFDGTKETVSLSDFNKYRISKESGVPIEKGITGLRYLQDIKGQIEIAVALLKAQIVV
jgi:hypothetical protein